MKFQRMDGPLESARGDDAGPRIFISVGEPSGDLHAASLIGELRRLRPDVHCTGLGGPRMVAAGCRVLADMTELAIMWFARALWHLPQFLGLLRQVDAHFQAHRPDVVVLIDYPGFNWWVARRAKRHGIPVVYYGTPQIWAWARWRVKKLRRLTDHVLCKLPFEASWFAQRGCNAHSVGHPYFDHLASRPLDQNWMARVTEQHGRLVTILPGSRTQEVEKNLSAFLRTARRIQASVSDVHFAIASFNAAQAERARRAVDAAGLTTAVDVHVGRTPELIAAADCCLACSGSVSLELLYHTRPAVILYTVSRWAYAVQRHFRKVRYITLANLLATDDIFTERPFTYDPDAPGAVRVPFPEYLTCNDVSQRMARHVIEWLTDTARYAEKVRELECLKQQVVGHEASRAAASQRAAQYILTSVMASNDWRSKRARWCTAADPV